ncbi:CC171 protein, partial [Chloropsis hardwickii]|nr:CC171 protein [Chloropsis hardwickii]
LCQRMADAHVLAKQPDAPLEELPWTEICALLHENVEALILNFQKANERVSVPWHQLLLLSSVIFVPTAVSLKRTDLIFLPFLFGLFLAQECEEMAQKKRQKLYGLEQMCKKLAHENNSMRNTFSNAHKDRSSLLAACALLSGALYPLYNRLFAMSCQQDIFQDQMNRHQLANQKIISLLYALPTNMKNNQDEGRLRQRRAKHLVYVFRRAVIAVLAANRLRALARYSCTLFVWTHGSRGGTGIQVCVGESRGRCHLRFCFTGFEEEGVDCIEALDWLTSSNLSTAIISSISELEDVLSKQDPNSWLSGHSLISAARNCFAKLMDNLSILMETVQGNLCGCRVYLERGSLMQRLACGLCRVNAQALEAGF